MAGAPQEEPLQPLRSLAMMHFSSCVVPAGEKGLGGDQGASVTLYKDLYTPCKCRFLQALKL